MCILNFTCFYYPLNCVQRVAASLEVGVPCHVLIAAPGWPFQTDALCHIVTVPEGRPQQIDTLFLQGNLLSVGQERRASPRMAVLCLAWFSLSSELLVFIQDGGGFMAVSWRIMSLLSLCPCSLAPNSAHLRRTFENRTWEIYVVLCILKYR